MKWGRVKKNYELSYLFTRVAILDSYKEAVPVPPQTLVGINMLTFMEKYEPADVWNCRVVPYFVYG